MRPACLPSSLFTTAALILAGCASTHVPVDRTADMPDYGREIHIIKPSPEGDPREVYPRIVEGLSNIGFSVVELDADSPLLGGQGTAFPVSRDGHFVSAAHVFDKHSSASLWLGGVRYDAVIEKTDEDLDLALLRADLPDNSEIMPLRLAADPDYRMGDDVFTIGFPMSDVLGRQPRLNRGLVSAAVGLKDDPDYLQVSVETQPGNSGSPLFNNHREVVGVMLGTLHAGETMRATGGGAVPQNVNFAVKLAPVRAFLENAGLDLGTSGDSEMPEDFEEISQLVAQARAGTITDEVLDAQRLGCLVAYRSIWDLWRRFSFFHVIFFDMDTGDIVFVAGQTGDNLVSNERIVIERTLEEIRKVFFPE